MNLAGYGWIWIVGEHDRNQKMSAFDAMAQVELLDPVAASDRARTPMISPDGVSPFQAAWLDRLLPKLITPLVGAVEAKLYSWHSMRIYRACALLAAGASVNTIQAMCRWQTEESLNIYARLDRATYATQISRALRAEFFTARTTTIDFEIDNTALVAELLRARDSDLEPAGAAVTVTADAPPPLVRYA